MADHSNITRFRVHYYETDQMGTFYNARALEWFERGRTELLRKLGVAYAQMEEKGVFLPLVESHVEYLGRAKYDDELEMTASVTMAGKARVRFEISVVQVVGGAGVARGYTVHAVTDKAGKPARPPAWLVEMLA